MSKPRIGWIGLGHMGVPMTANLMKAGFPLMVWNRTRSKAEAIEGAFVAASPADLAQGVDILVTMLSDDASQEEVLFGPGGVAEGAKIGQIIINMGTISPQASRSAAIRLGQLGVLVLDAPVSGSVKPATDGTLVILVGGDAEALARCQPVFDVLGKRTFHFGKAGQGANAKLAINMMLGTMLQAAAETVVFGEAAGLDRGLLLDMIAETPCASPIFNLKAPTIRADSYPPAFPLKHMAKDFRLMLEAANGADISVAEAVSANFQKAEAEGLGDQDVMAVIKVLEG